MSLQKPFVRVTAPLTQPPSTSKQDAKAVGFGKVEAYALRRIGAQWPGMTVWSTKRTDLEVPPGYERVKLTIEPD